MNELPAFDPRMHWLTISIRALMKTHPNPELLRQTWTEMAELLIAQMTAHSRGEPWFQGLLALRDGYEAWLPDVPPAAG